MRSKHDFSPRLCLNITIDSDKLSPCLRNLFTSTDQNLPPGHNSVFYLSKTKFFLGAFEPRGRGNKIRDKNSMEIYINKTLNNFKIYPQEIFTTSRI